MAQKIPQSVYTYIRIASTFGLTMGMNIYLLSVLAGGWLDEKFGTEPLIRLLLLFVAIGMSFLYLFKQIEIAGEVEKEGSKKDKEDDG
ncbi:MAG: AtpZ/AtpI family protein [Bacillota bacterium]|nr:AtpZ/AtpI family protein [Bacillota bacterium]